MITIEQVKAAMKENEDFFDDPIDEVAAKLTDKHLAYISQRVTQRTLEGYIKAEWERDLEIAMQVVVSLDTPAVLG